MSQVSLVFAVQLPLQLVSACTLSVPVSIQPNDRCSSPPEQPRCYRNDVANAELLHFNLPWLVAPT